MKKLATLVVAVASFAIASPVFACPNMDHAGAADEAPRTAEKDKKETPKATDQAKAKEQPKADKAKEQPAKPAEGKKAEKVSIK
jgi:hypothetical protein